MLFLLIKLILGLPPAREPSHAHLSRHRVALSFLPHMENHPQRLRDGDRDRPRENVAQLDGLHSTGLARPHRPQLLRQFPHIRPALEKGEEKGEEKCRRPSKSLRVSFQR